METLSLNGTVLKPLPLKYAYDSDVKIKNFNEYFTSGVVFSFNPILHEPEDLSTNNYSNLILSNKADTSSFMYLTGTAPEFPRYLQTNMKSKFNRYWEITGDDSANLDSIQCIKYDDPSKLTINNRFEIVLLNHVDCLVRVNTNGRLKYLTFLKDKYQKDDPTNAAFKFQEAPNIKNELAGYLGGDVISSSAQTSEGSDLGFSTTTQIDTLTRVFSYVYNGADQIILLLQGIEASHPILLGNNVIRTGISGTELTVTSLTGFSETSIIFKGGYLGGTLSEQDEEDLRLTDGSVYFSKIRDIDDDGNQITDVWGRAIYEYVYNQSDLRWFDPDRRETDGRPLAGTAGIDQPQGSGGHGGKLGDGYVVRLLGVTGSERPLRSFTAEDIIYIRSKPDINGLYNLPSRWHSYVDSTETNHLSVDSNKSFSNIKNNYMIASTHNDIITSGVMTNFIPLKNQLTPKGQIARGNPYDTDHDVTFREYQKMHTGSNQEHGNTDLVLTYTADTTEYTFKPDKLTYFHIPYKTSPYKLLNINNSSLVKSGAIAGSSPITSDKMFKKMEKDYTVVFRDEQNGQWLCSWLRANENPSKSPAWIDRYYNPYTTTREEALTATNDGRFYVDKFTTTVNVLQTSAKDYFDKISDLSFEPGGLYAYHRLGPKYMSSMLDLYDHNKQTKKISFRNANSFPKSPHTVNNITHYNLNGNRYGITNDMQIEGSFTVTFDLSCADWSKTIGNQILGNYTNAGIGFYSDQSTTPYITIPDGNTIKIYNTDFILLHTIADITAKYILRKGGSDNIFVIDNDNLLHEYDTNFILQNKTNLNIVDVTTPDNSELLSDKSIYVDTFIDVDIDNTNMYFNTYTDLLDTQNYLVYNYNEENKFFTSFNYTPSNSSTSIDISPNGVYIPKADSNAYNSLTVDSKGNAWQLYTHNSNKYVYKTETGSISSTKTSDIFAPGAAPQTSVIHSTSNTDTLEGIVCDEKDYIWLLHSGNKVSKLNLDRKVIFTKTLSDTPASSTRYIDFVREYTDKGLQVYAIIINQSNAGSNVIKVNLDGTVKDTISLYEDPRASTLVPISSFDSNLSAWKSVTGYDFLRKWKIDKQHNITCKFSVQNLYENDVIRNTFKEFELSYGVAHLKPGWHTFTFRFDAENGLFVLFVDGKEKHSMVVRDHRARYSFLNLFKQPLMLGATPHHGSELLADHLKQKKYYFTNKCKIANIDVWKESLETMMVAYLTNRRYDIKALRWNVPSGRRNFVDTVERFFKFDFPGSTSNYVDVVIENSYITDVDVRADIEQEVRKTFATVAPGHVQLNKIEFRQNEA